MGQDLFRKLPPEITIEILSRLPIHKAIKCKLVAKSWRSLIESPEFVECYKSDPCWAVTQQFNGDPFLYKVYKVEDGDENSKNNSFNEAFNFTFPHLAHLRNSVNGLLFMIVFSHNMRPHMYVCNPVTREYIAIPSPQPQGIDARNVCYGFGVSRKSGQYKVVRIFDEYSNKGVNWYRVGYQVYTLGTGLWRSVDPRSISRYYENFRVGAFLNGNFHWLAYDHEKGLWWISCFDLETEMFTTLSAPHLADYKLHKLHALRDCLGIFDYSCESELVVWLMKDYGDDRSWTKQFVISIVNHPNCRRMRVIHVFRDGDVLLRGVDATGLFCYSDKTKTIKEADDDLIQLQGLAYFVLASYTPSFLSLKTFSSTENVSSF